MKPDGHKKQKLERRTIIYQKQREGVNEIADKDFRDSLDLLKKILSTYERARARYVQALSASENGDLEEPATWHPP